MTHPLEPGLASCAQTTVRSTQIQPGSTRILLIRQLGHPKLTAKTTIRPTINPSPDRQFDQNQQPRLAQPIPYSDQAQTKKKLWHVRARASYCSISSLRASAPSGDDPAKIRHPQTPPLGCFPSEWSVPYRPHPCWLRPISTRSDMSPNESHKQSPHLAPVVRAHLGHALEQAPNQPVPQAKRLQAITLTGRPIARQGHLRAAPYKQACT